MHSIPDMSLRVRDEMTWSLLFLSFLILNKSPLPCHAVYTEDPFNFLTRLRCQIWSRCRISIGQQLSSSVPQFILNEANLIKKLSSTAILKAFGKQLPKRLRFIITGHIRNCAFRNLA